MRSTFNKIKEITFHKYIYLVIWFICLSPALVKGQGVADTQIVIEKEKEIKLKPASKSFEKIKLVEPAPERVRLLYRPEEPYFQSEPFTMNPNPYLPSKDNTNPDELLNNHNLYLKAGIGNYGTTLFEAYLQQPLQEQLHFGGFIKHLASRNGEVADDFSGASENAIQAYAKYFMYNSRINGKLSYQRNVNRFFGYPENIIEGFDKDSLKQIYNRIRLCIEHQSTDPESVLQYKWGLSAANLTDNFEASEWQVNLFGNANYQLSENSGIQVDLEALLSQRKDSASQNRNLFKISPAYTYQQDNIFVKIGLGLAYDNDTTGGSSGQAYVYPQIRGSYQLNNNLSIYASLEGDLQTRSLDYFAAQNPFITDNILLAHTDKEWEAGGGVRFSPLPNLSVDLGASYGSYQNAAFFLNSAEDSARFDVVYETDKTNLFKFSGKLTYVESEKYDITLSTNFYNYSLNTLEEAWHRPTLEANILAGFFPLPKLYIQGNLLFQSGIKAKNLSTDNQVTLDAITDLSFKADYLFFNNFSAYLSVNNIFNKSYQRFLNYPNQRLNYLIGITYAF